MHAEAACRAQQPSLICLSLKLATLLTLHHAQIEMGSTNIRVGSTIFGARDYSKPKEATAAPATSS